MKSNFLYNQLQVENNELKETNKLLVGHCARLIGVLAIAIVKSKGIPSEDLELINRMRSEASTYVKEIIEKYKIK